MLYQFLSIYWKFPIVSIASSASELKTATVTGKFLPLNLFGQGFYIYKRVTFGKKASQKKTFLRRGMLAWEAIDTSFHAHRYVSVSPNNCSLRTSGETQISKQPITLHHHPSIAIFLLKTRK